MFSYSSRVPHIRVIAFTCFPLFGHRWAGTPLLRFGLAYLIFDGFVQVVRLQAEFVNRVGAAGAQHVLTDAGQKPMALQVRGVSVGLRQGQLAVGGGFGGSGLKCLRRLRCSGHVS